MLNVTALVVLMAFYTLILVVGVLMAWKKRTRPGSDVMESSIVAGRELGTVVGIFTMTATTVGGGYINGTAESVAKDGLVWTLAPFGIFLGLILGGLIFAHRMREAEYLTMLDPFQRRYGNISVLFIYAATLCGDVFWTASILSALGTSLSVMIGIDLTVAICTSAAVTVVYTMIGQMISVAYTDIVQLILITLGLVLSVPFVFTSDHMGDIGQFSSHWLGHLEPQYGGVWFDLFMAMTFGTIPWQAYFQRVLSVKSARQAQVLSVVGACSALILVIPSVLIGAAGVSGNWTNTSLGMSPLDIGKGSMILPYVLHEFTPTAVAILGLGSISAAVMSSMDSSILGSSSMFTHNLYQNFLRTKATSAELLWVQRGSILCVGALSTVISIFVPIVYGLFILAADIVFVIVLPQLFCAVFLRFTNVYGSLAGYFVGLVLRIGAGESSLSIPPFIYFPFYTQEDGQLFPFRTFSMLCSLGSICVISVLSNYLFQHQILSPKFDILGYSRQLYELNDTSQPDSVCEKYRQDTKQEMVFLANGACDIAQDDTN